MAVNGHNVTISTTALFVNSTELKQLSLGASTHVNATFPFDVYYATNLLIRHLSFWVMLFLFLLMGIFGNLTILYILVIQWGCRSTFTFFKALLSAMQTLKCTVMAPLFFYALLSHVSQNRITSTVCKFHRTATTFFMLSTCLLLLLGGRARNAMASAPWKITNFKMAKVKAASGLSISAFISLPAMVIYGTVEDETHNHIKIGFFEGCIILPEYRDSLSSKAFIGLVDSLFALFTVILLVTYTCLCWRFQGRLESRLGSRNFSIGELFPSRSWSDYSFLMNDATGASDRLGGMFVPNSDGEAEVSLVMGREVINSMINFESMFNKQYAAKPKSAVGEDADKATGQRLENPGSISVDPAMPSDKAGDVVSKDAGMKHAPSTSKSKKQTSQLGPIESSSVDNTRAFSTAAKVKKMRGRIHNPFHMPSALNDVLSDSSQSDAIYVGPKNQAKPFLEENAIIPFDSDSEISEDSDPHRSFWKKVLGKRDERSTRGKYLLRYSASPSPNRSHDANDEKNSDTKDNSRSAGVETTTKPSNHALTTPSNHSLSSISEYQPVIAHTNNSQSLGIGRSILNLVAPNLLASSQTSLKRVHNDHQTETIGEAMKKLSRGRGKSSMTMAQPKKKPSDKDHMTRAISKASMTMAQPKKKLSDKAHMTRAISKASMTMAQPKKKPSDKAHMTRAISKASTTMAQPERKPSDKDHMTRAISKASTTMAQPERKPSDKDHMTRTRKTTSEATSVIRVMQSESPVYCAEESSDKRTGTQSNGAILSKSLPTAVSAEPLDVKHTQSKGIQPTSVKGSSKSLTAHPPLSEANSFHSSTDATRTPSFRFKESQVDANAGSGSDVVKKGHRVRNPTESRKSTNFSGATGSAQGNSGSVQLPKAQSQAQQYWGEKGKTRMHKLMSKPSTLKNRLKRRSRELKKRMSKRFSWGNYHQETRGIMSFSRTFVVSCVLFLSFLGSYIPIVVLQSLEVFLPEYYNRMTGELLPLKHVSYLLFFTSDFVHPIMWGFINNSFRREVRHLFSDCGWKRRLILESQSDLQSSTVPAPRSPRPSIVWRRKGK